MNRLLAGPDLRRGAESYADHNRRLGQIPAHGRDFIDVLARSGLTGRGGASFPVSAKWEAVAKHSRGNAVILVNGAEGEPQSKKDRVLMGTRPHLILDGAFVAARQLGARKVFLYIGEGHAASRNAMLRAVSERPDHERRLISTVAAPARYVAGQEAAAIHLINDGIAVPTTTPPLPFERGVDGAPTLVQNVETLAHIGLLARRSEYTPGALITVAGAIAYPGVLEIEIGTTIGEVITQAGGASESPRAILVGGYFGSWVAPQQAWNLLLDPTSLRAHGLGLGCGVIGVLPQRRCPVCETAGIMRYLAGESSAQCGPCFFGLRALADACTRTAEQGTNGADLARLQRWAGDVRGRGACRHPDGAVIFLQSALKVFAHEFANHAPHHAMGEVTAA